MDCCIYSICDSKLPILDITSLIFITGETGEAGDDGIVTTVGWVGILML